MVQKVEVETKTFVRFWLVILALGLLGLFIWRALTGLILIAIAVFLAIAIKPLANQIDKIDKSKKRATLTSVIAFIIILGAIIAIISVVGPVVVNETSHFINQVPKTVNETIGGWQGINALGQKFGVSNLQQQISTAISSFSAGLLSDIGGTIVTSVSTTVSIVTGIILVMVLTILLLLQGPSMMSGFWRFVGEHNKEAAIVWKRIANKVAGVISKYVTGQILVAILDGTAVAILVFVLAVIFNLSPGMAFPFALIAFIFYLIPMFGPIIGCIINSLLLFFSNPVAGIIFAIVYAIYSQIENNLIAPKVQGNALKLPSFIILASITIGIYMFGLIGAIISIPIAGCIKVFIEEYPNIKRL